MGLVHISRHGVLALVFNFIKPHIDNDCGELVSCAKIRILADKCIIFVIC